MSKKPLVLFSALLLALPPLFGGLTAELPLYIFYAAAFTGLAFITVPLSADKKSFALNSPLDLALPLFALAYLFATISAASRNAAVNEVIKLLALFAVYIFVRYLVSDKKNIKHLIGAVALSSCVAATAGIVFAVRKTALPVSSLLYNSNAFGIICVVGLLIFAGFMLEADSKLKKLLSIAFSGLLIAGVILSGSLLSLILLLVGLVFLCANKGKKAFASFGLFIAVYVIISAAMLAFSPDLRGLWLANPFASKAFTEWLVFWADSLAAAKNSPIIGHGGSGWSIVHPTFQSFTYSTSLAHNYIMQIAVDCGIIGLIVLAAFIAVFSKSILRSFKQIPLISIVVSILFIHNLLSASFHVTAVSIIFWALLAMVAPLAPKDNFKLKTKASTFVVFAIVMFAVSAMLLLNYNSKTVAQKYLDKQNYAKAAPMYKQAIVFNYFDDISRLNYMYSHSMYLGTDKNVDSTEVYKYALKFNSDLAKIVTANKKNIAILKLCQDLYRQTYNTDLAISVAEYITDIDPLDPSGYELLAEAYVNKIIVLTQQDNPDMATIQKLYSYVITIPDVIVKNTENKKEQVNPTETTLQLIGASTQELAKLQSNIKGSAEQ